LAPAPGPRAAAWSARAGPAAAIESARAMAVARTTAPGSEDPERPLAGEQRALLRRAGVIEADLHHQAAQRLAAVRVGVGHLALKVCADPADLAAPDQPPAAGADRVTLLDLVAVLVRHEGDRDLALERHDVGRAADLLDDLVVAGDGGVQAGDLALDGLLARRVALSLDDALGVGAARHHRLVGLGAAEPADRLVRHGAL